MIPIWWAKKAQRRGLRCGFERLKMQRVPALSRAEIEGIWPISSQSQIKAGSRCACRPAISSMGKGAMANSSGSGRKRTRCGSEKRRATLAAGWRSDRCRRPRPAERQYAKGYGDAPPAADFRRATVDQSSGRAVVGRCVQPMRQAEIARQIPAAIRQLWVRTAGDAHRCSSNNVRT